MTAKYRSIWISDIHLGTRGCKIDSIKNGINGYLDNDLKNACIRCLKIDRNVVRNEALNYSWDVCTDTFLHVLQKIT